ncbi:MAG: ABC transporter permease [Nitrososphaerales archaeon]|nr:ABC transporter permease [Nitrososphaerales archaeon]
MFFIALSIYVTKIATPSALANPLGLNPVTLGPLAFDPSIFVNVAVYGGIAFVLHRLYGNRIVTIGFLVLVFATLYVPIPRMLWSFDPQAANSIDFSQRYCWNNPYINWGTQASTCAPGTSYLLGTDGFGRDLFRMMLMAIPLDLGIALSIVLIASSFGVAIGAVAAYAGGKTDELLLRITDVFFAFPGLILALVLAAILGRTITTLTLAVLVVFWPVYVRLIRGQILAEKEKNYVEALRSLGMSARRILFVHILPNSIYPVLVQVTLDIGGVILTFSALMFLGFSPSPALPELGNLAADGIGQIFIAPWLVIFPGLAIVLISVSFNLIGDGLRDVLDPRLRR